MREGVGGSRANESVRECVEEGARIEERWGREPVREGVRRERGGGRGEGPRIETETVSTRGRP
ncbi:hypothetical protein AMTR_s00136p00044100 [Amborella trichopoda]|uniref:Uncharacterized protein n=1 Tax=Amborella trichopoda TaxID=13333 RepID=W1NDY8_AMBTC|nr:hypothetical protein AMTR_s00136p00044100 [Amborella trichopoda]